MYYLWFLSCEADRIDDLEVRGYTEWKNPHGYLPGMMAPYLPFYMALSMAAIILAFWWFRRAVTYWREITTLQILLSGTEQKTTKPKAEPLGNEGKPLVLLGRTALHLGGLPNLFPYKPPVL